MRSRLSVFILLAVCLVFGLLFAREILLGNRLLRETFTGGKLRVLTYASFVSPSGPGGEILERFKMQNHCDVEVVTTTDAGLLLERLKLAPPSMPFDVVIGLDQLLLQAAAQQREWKSVSIGPQALHSEAVLFGTSPFVPLDWSPMGFIYRQGEIEPPHDFADLLSPRFKNLLALQDPRASSPGLQFLNWVRDVEREKTSDFLEKLKPNVQSVSPSWAFSYGLFKKHQAKLVFSYVTSLAYHWGVEKDESYHFASLSEGHPVQVEFAAIPANCRECALADAFVKALLEKENQTLIAQKNYMFPALKGVAVGDAFARLPTVKIRATSNPSDKNFSDWDKVFKR